MTASDAKANARGSRRADAELNDARIVTAAVSLLEEGAEIPSIREVARRAGVGTTTIYRRFESLPALQSRATAVHICNLLEPVVETAQKDDDPMRAFRRLSLSLIHHVQGPWTAPMSLPDLIAEYLARFGDAITRLMHRAQRSGGLRTDITVQDIAGVTVAMLAGVTQAGPWIGSPDRYVALIFDGLGRTDAPRLPDPQPSPRK